MIFLYDLLCLFGYFFIMLLFMFTAIVLAKTKASWIFFSIGAILQLMTIYGNRLNRQTEQDDSLVIIDFIVILIITFAIIISIKNKKFDEKMKDSTTVTDIYIDIFKNGYLSGDFSEIFSFLSDDCTLENNEEKEQKNGKPAVIEFFKAKKTDIENRGYRYKCKKIQSPAISEPPKNTTSSNTNETSNNNSYNCTNKVGQTYLVITSKTEAKDNLMLKIQLNDNNLISKIFLCDINSTDCNN